MSKFKVGDVVRRTDEMPHGGMKKGDIGTVSEVKESGAIRFKEFDYLDRGYWWDNKSYELVSPRSAQPDVKDMNLDELIECANRGNVAYRRLYKEFHSKTERMYISGCWSTINHSPDTIYLRKKPQKTFEPYTIESTGWGVRVPHNERLRYGSEADNKVVIGCKTFNAKDLLAALKALAVSQEPEYPKASNLSGDRLRAFKATIKGVLYEGHVLPWSDAEVLMKKLEDYLEGAE